MKHLKLWYAFCHANIIVSCMFIIFYFIDRVNSAMDFMGSSLSKGLLFAFCLCILASSILNARYLYVLMNKSARRYGAQDPITNMQKRRMAHGRYRHSA